MSADGADVVIVCVFTDEQVQEVCLDSDLLPSMKPGSVLVVHTTGSPQTAEAIAARADRHFIDVVDAPISGSPHDVAAGQVTLYVGGGDRRRQVCAVLASYGDPLLHVGPLGAGQCVKLVNNLLFAAQIGLVAEAVQLASRLGIVEPTLLKALPSRQCDQLRNHEDRRGGLNRNVYRGLGRRRRQRRFGDSRNRRRLGYRHRPTP